MGREPSPALLSLNLCLLLKVLGGHCRLLGLSLAVWWPQSLSASWSDGACSWAGRASTSLKCSELVLHLWKVLKLFTIAVPNVVCGSHQQLSMSKMRSWYFPMLARVSWKQTKDCKMQILELWKVFKYLKEMARVACIICYIMLYFPWKKWRTWAIVYKLAVWLLACIVLLNPEITPQVNLAWYSLTNLLMMSESLPVF